MNEPTDPRVEAMVEMRLKGKSLTEVGKVFGITRERVRQLTTNYVKVDREKINQRNRTYSDEQCLEALIEYLSDHDEWPSKRQYNAWRQVPTASTICKRFGSWVKALAAADKYLESGEK